MLDVEWLMYGFFTRKFSPTSKNEEEDGRHINTNIGEGQDHKTKKSLSVFGVEFDSRNDLATLGDMEILYTYITHSCDNQELDT
jgi:hypothetical protein